MRSRLDIRLGRQLKIGQTVRHRDTSLEWTIDQLYRQDCEALLRRPGTRLIVTFAQLRTEYDLVVPIQAAAA